MEFDLEKCRMFIIKRGKRGTTEEIELPNQERIRMVGKKKENCKYLELLGADTIKQAEMKEKIGKEYIRRTRELLKRTSIAVISTKG